MPNQFFYDNNSYQFKYEEFAPVFGSTPHTFGALHSINVSNFDFMKLIDLYSKNFRKVWVMKLHADFKTALSQIGIPITKEVTLTLENASLHSDHLHEILKLRNALSKISGAIPGYPGTFDIKRLEEYYKFGHKNKTDSVARRNFLRFTKFKSIYLKNDKMEFGIQVDKTIDSFPSLKANDQYYHSLNDLTLFE